MQRIIFAIKIIFILWALLIHMKFGPSISPSEVIFVPLLNHEHWPLQQQVKPAELLQAGRSWEALPLWHFLHLDIGSHFGSPEQKNFLNPFPDEQMSNILLMNFFRLGMRRKYFIIAFCEDETLSKPLAVKSSKLWPTCEFFAMWRHLVTSMRVQVTSKRWNCGEKNVNWEQIWTLCGQFFFRRVGNMYNTSCTLGDMDLKFHHDIFWFFCPNSCVSINTTVEFDNFEKKTLFDIKFVLIRKPAIETLSSQHESHCQQPDAATDPNYEDRKWLEDSKMGDSSMSVLLEQVFLLMWINATLLMYVLIIIRKYFFSGCANETMYSRSVTRLFFF